MGRVRNRRCGFFACRGGHWSPPKKLLEDPLVSPVARVGEELRALLEGEEREAPQDVVRGGDVRQVRARDRREPWDGTAKDASGLSGGHGGDVEGSRPMGQSVQSPPQGNLQSMSSGVGPMYTTN